VSLRTKITIFLTLYIAATFAVLASTILELERDQFTVRSRAGATALLNDFVKAVRLRWNPSPTGEREALDLPEFKSRFFKDPRIVYVVFQDPSDRLVYVPKLAPAFSGMAETTRLTPFLRRSLLLRGTNERTLSSYPEGSVTELLVLVRGKDNEPLGVVRLGLQESVERAALKEFTRDVLGRLLFVNGVATAAGFLLVFVLAGRLEFSVRRLHLRAREILGSPSPFEESRDVLTLLTREFEGIEKLIKSLKEDRSHFVSTLSHELRSPLQIILGYADFLSRDGAGPLGKEAKECLSMIKESAGTFRAIIDNLLDLVRLDGRRLPVSVRPFLVGPVIDEAVKAMRGQAEEHGMALETDVPGVKAATGDPVRVYQVLLNLLSNALKYTPTGGIIRIGVRNGGATLEFYVKDSGPGIPPEERERVFEEFYQATAVPPARGSKGIGIGLTLCRRLVEIQGGRIWFEGSDTGGAEVRFTLPAASPGAVKAAVA
jgi:signal transduction histidine kinase